MSRFVLKPVRVLQNFLSVIKDSEEETYTFEELVHKFVPNRDPKEGMKLGLLKPGCFVGLVTGARSQRPVVFVLHNLDNTGNIDFVLKKDPTFATRFLCGYKVEETAFDAKITESRSSEEAA